MSNQVSSGELLFVKSVKDGIPNRDPLRDSDARRIFGEEDGRVSLSDVSVKRDVRDYALTKYPEGGDSKTNYVFVRREEKEEGGRKLLGRKGIADKTLKDAGLDKQKDKRTALMTASFDMRVFGAVFSVGGENFHDTGPVQFGWAHSLHPVESKYVQGTVVLPSADIKATEAGEETGKTQGTIWSTYMIPFAIFVMPGVINPHLAQKTGMAKDDLELLVEGLWKGTLMRQARGRGLQKPLFLLHVEYKDPLFRIGYLEEYVSLEPGRDVWLSEQRPTSLKEITLDVSSLGDLLSKNQDAVDTARLWLDPELNLVGREKIAADVQKI